MSNEKVLVITSFSDKGFTQYGKAFIDSFVSNWPLKKGSLDLRCFYHSTFPLKEGVPLWDGKELEHLDKVAYTSLDQLEWLTSIKETFLSSYAQRNPNCNGVIPWQHDVVKFINKVAALGWVLNDEDVVNHYDWVIWLDADTKTISKVSKTFISKQLLDSDADIIRLGRRDANYSETSFVAFKVTPNVVNFVKRLVGVYATHDYYNYTEYHDGFVFERLLNQAILSEELAVKNISPEAKGLDAFHQSPLKEIMTHDKGNKKQEGGATLTATRLTNEKRANPYMPGSGEFKAYHPSAKPIVIHPTDSADTACLQENIKENLSLIDNWLNIFAPLSEEEGEIIVVSGGPSNRKYLNRIKEHLSNNPKTKVMCVKHSYPVLIENGIIPDYCVALDPREVEGDSTLGHKRSSLYLTEEKTNKTIFLVASMTHPSVTKLLLDNGKTVLGWHATNKEVIDIWSKSPELFKKASYPNGLESIPTGTCSAIRGISLMTTLGFSKFILCGFDGSVNNLPDGATEETDSFGNPKYYRVWLPALTNDYSCQFIPKQKDASLEYANPIGGRYFWVTGEMIALYQDFLGAIPAIFNNNTDLKLTTWLDENTLIGEGWRRLSATKNAQKAQEESIENLKNSRGSFLSWLSKVYPTVV